MLPDKPLFSFNLFSWFTITYFMFQEMYFHECMERGWIEEVYWTARRYPGGYDIIECQGQRAPWRSQYPCHTISFMDRQLQFTV